MLQNAQLRIVSRLHNAGDAVAAYALCDQVGSSNHSMFRQITLRAFRSGDLPQAQSYAQSWTTLEPQSKEAWWTLAKIHYALWDRDSAVHALERAQTLDPANPAIASLLLYLSLLDDSLTGLDRLRNHRSWSKQFVGRVRAREDFPNDRDHRRRLRVGYVVQAFTEYPESTYMQPFLELHDRSEVEVFAYTSTPADCASNFTDVQWRDISELSASEAAELILQDRIDILVDNDGHINPKAMQIFARRTAPVQVSLQNYPASTGLSAMDYRITDEGCVPTPASRRQYSEELFCIAGSSICFSPTRHYPEVGPLPYDRNGFITFGAFQNPLKINEGCIARWSAILRALPDARLVIHHALGGMGCRNFGSIDPSLKDRFQRQFTDNRIEVERIAFVGALSHWDHLDLHNEIDIMLDTLPFSGYTTTLESLWMGVPVVAANSHDFVSGMSAAILHHLGLKSLVTTNNAFYPALAIRLAKNPKILRKLRGGLRSMMKSSPLMNGVKFVHEVEKAYRVFWREWSRESGSNRTYALQRVSR